MHIVYIYLIDRGRRRRGRYSGIVGCGSEDVSTAPYPVLRCYDRRQLFQITLDC